MKFTVFLLMLLAPLAQARWQKPPAVNCGKLYATTYGPTSRELEQLARGDDFFDLHSPIPSQAKELSDDVIDALKKEPVPGRASSRTLTELTDTQMNQLFTNIKETPQVKETVLCNERYKNSDRQGFCFGRAIAAHFKALQFGVNNKSIRKLWAVGRLDMDGIEWRYHVTTIVRGKGGQWYALDPVLNHPVTIEEWHRMMREEYNPAHNLRLFATPAKQFGRAAKYSHGDFSRKIFNGFFEDLLTEVRSTNRARGELRPTAPPTKAEKEFTSAWVKGGAGAAGAGLSAAAMYELYKLLPETSETKN